MPIFGLISLIFGIIIITNPDFIAYIIGFIFVFIGLNAIVLSGFFRRNTSQQKSSSWKLGDYEIIKNRK